MSANHHSGSPFLPLPLGCPHSSSKVSNPARKLLRSPFLTLVPLHPVSPALKAQLQDTEGNLAFDFSLISVLGPLLVGSLGSFPSPCALLLPWVTITA